MYITIDIGGTNIRVASFEPPENNKPKRIFSLKTENDYDKDIEKIIYSINKFEPRPQAIAFALKGSIDKEKTKSISTRGLFGWSNRPLKKDMEQLFGCPVFLENDTALAAIGEASKLQTKENFIFIIWGTGLGGAEIKFSEGKIEYFPFEPGHEIIIEENGREGTCGHKGDLESYVGGASIEKFYQKKAKELSNEEWGEIKENMVKGLVLLNKTRPYKKLIFGGGISINQPQIVKEINELLNKELGKEIKITTSALGDNAALYGGLELIRLN